MTAWARGAL